MSNYRIEALNKQHDKERFSCGISALDNYLKHQASQDKRRHISATYILTEIESYLVVGYYTLSSTSILLTSLPETITQKLPRYPTLPATLLGRLAVDLTFQNRNLGELLLIDALKRSLKISDEVGSCAVVVDSKNDSSTHFYLKYGFTPFTDHGNRLFLLVDTIRKL